MSETGTSTIDQLNAAFVGRYRIERELGAGGMATVYLALNLKHDREVAIKVLRADLSAVLGVERFLAEVRITARLDHPHILTLIDSGEANGIRYHVLPVVRGESLRCVVLVPSVNSSAFSFAAAWQAAAREAARHRRGDRAHKAGSQRARLRACAGRRASRHQAREYPHPSG